MSNKIDKNIIGWIENGSQADQDTLNKPSLDLAEQLEGFEFPDEITQNIGNGIKSVISQAQVSAFLSGWGQDMLPKPIGAPQENCVKSGLYDQDGVEFGSTPGNSPTIMLILSNRKLETDSHVVHQFVLGNGIRYRKGVVSSIDQEIQNWNAWQTVNLT